METISDKTPNKSFFCHLKWATIERIVDESHKEISLSERS